MFTQPEEWVLLGSCSSYKQLQKLGTSGATAAAEAEAAAAAAASAAAPTVGSKRWMPKNLPGHLRGVFDIGTNDDDSSSASTNPISSWLQAKLLPSMPGLGRCWFAVHCSQEPLCCYLSPAFTMPLRHNPSSGWLVVPSTLATCHALPCVGDCLWCRHDSRAVSDMLCMRVAATSCPCHCSCRCAG